MRELGWRVVALLVAMACMLACACAWSMTTLAPPLLATAGVLAAHSGPLRPHIEATLLMYGVCLALGLAAPALAMTHDGWPLVLATLAFGVSERLRRRHAPALAMLMLFWLRRPGWPDAVATLGCLALMCAGVAGVGRLRNWV